MDSKHTEGLGDVQRKRSDPDLVYSMIQSFANLQRVDYTKSDVLGDGYGSKHLWKKQRTYAVGCAPPETKGTEFKCARCGVLFVHRYALYPDIFDAMKRCEIPEECKKV